MSNVAIKSKYLVGILTTLIVGGGVISLQTQALQQEVIPSPTPTNTKAPTITNKTKTPSTITKTVAPAPPVHANSSGSKHN